MKRKLLAVGVVASLISISIALPSAQAISLAHSNNANSAVYNFKATTLQGKNFPGLTLAGKPSLLWFWAPWCSICRGESPDLVALSKAYKGKINLVGVASLGPVGDMKKFVSDTHTSTFTHLADPNGLIWGRFNIISQPSFVFISKSGVTYRLVGSLSKSDLFSLTDEIIKKA